MGVGFGRWVWALGLGVCFRVGFGGWDRRWGVRVGFVEWVWGLGLAIGFLWVYLVIEFRDWVRVFMSRGWFWGCILEGWVWRLGCG